MSPDQLVGDTAVANLELRVRRVLGPHVGVPEPGSNRREITRRVYPLLVIKAIEQLGLGQALAGLRSSARQDPANSSSPIAPAISTAAAKAARYQDWTSGFGP